MQVLFIYYTIVGNLKHKEMNNGELETHDLQGDEPVIIERNFEHIKLTLEPKPNCIECNDFSILYDGEDYGDLEYFESFSFAKCVELGITITESYVYACCWELCNDELSLDEILTEMYNV